MQLDEPLGEGETQTGPLVGLGGRRLELGEFLEEPREVFGADARPGVGHGDFKEIAELRFLICDLRFQYRFAI